MTVGDLDFRHRIRAFMASSQTSKGWFLPLFIAAAKFSRRRLGDTVS